MTARGHSVLTAAAVMLMLAVVAAAWTTDPSSDSRAWEITYRATVTGIPSGTRSLKIWLPLPRDDDRQTISELEVDAPLPHRSVIDPEYRNHLIRFDADDRLPDSIELTMTFVALRKTGIPVPPDETGAALETQLDRLLGPDLLVPIDGVIAELSQSVTEGLPDDRARAAAIYAYVLRTMRYDKSGTGWGRGDALFACSERRGNCTDIHSLLIGMARAAGIPARFVMGFPVPAGDEGEIAGYHCWADLYIAGVGWVPVDASEAIKHPELAEEYFGRLDPNRVAFTVGRDIQLGEEGGAPRANYVIYPYVELEGTEESATVECRVTYRRQPVSPD